MTQDDDDPKSPDPADVATSEVQPWTEFARKGVVWFGAIGSLASIVALPLSFWISAQGGKPRLVFEASPLRTELVNQARPDDITVAFQGSEITEQSVVVASIQLWNVGRGSVRPSEVLKDVRVTVADGNRILRATVGGQSREIVGMQPSIENSTTAKLSWTILEYGDGAVLDLLYAGDPDAKIVVEGLVEGQGEIEPIDMQYVKSRKGGANLFRVAIWLAVLLLVLSIVPSAIQRFRTSVKRSGVARIMAVVELSLLLLFPTALMIWVLVDYAAILFWYPTFPPLQ